MATTSGRIAPSRSSALRWKRFASRDSKGTATAKAASTATKPNSEQIVAADQAVAKTLRSHNAAPQMRTARPAVVFMRRVKRSLEVLPRRGSPMGVTAAITTTETVGQIRPEPVVGIVTAVPTNPPRASPMLGTGVVSSQRNSVELTDPGR